MNYLPKELIYLIFSFIPDEEVIFELYPNLCECRIRYEREISWAAERASVKEHWDYPEINLTLCPECSYEPHKIILKNLFNGLSSHALTEEQHILSLVTQNSDQSIVEAFRKANLELFIFCQKSDLKYIPTKSRSMSKIMLIWSISLMKC